MDDAKIALEHLYNTGHLAICNRVNFQRVYDLRDRVLPAWVDRREPDVDEAMRSLLEISSKALGMCTPAQVAISANLLFVSRLSIVSLRYSAGGLTSGRGLGTAGVVPAQ